MNSCDRRVVAALFKAAAMVKSLVKAADAIMSSSIDRERCIPIRLWNVDECWS